MTPPSEHGLLFRECGMCGERWPSREAFLSDPGVALVGYQVDFRNLLEGLLLFNHRCKTTLSISVRTFRDLYSGPVFAARAEGTDDCPGYCLHTDVLDRCPAQCECAYVRDILQRIRSWPKHEPSAP